MSDSRTTLPCGVELALLLLLFLVAAWLFWHALLDVPPGLEPDELIEAEVAEQVLSGDLRPFYEAGQGREGLYYYWLALWLFLLGKGVFTLRLASTTMTLLGLAAVYVLNRRLFGPVVALIGLVLGATSFWVLFAARSGLRSTSLPLLAALAGYLFLRGLSPRPRLMQPLATLDSSLSTGEEEERSSKVLKGRDANRSISMLSVPVSAGLFLGLTPYAYTAGRVLFLVFVFFVIYLLLFKREYLVGRIAGLALCGAVAALVALPLILYLRTHPEADQFEFEDFNRPVVELKAGHISPALETTRDTLGMFALTGDPLMFDNVPNRPVFNPLLGVLLYAGVLIALVKVRNPAYAFILIWLVVSLLPGMLSQPAPNHYRTVSAQVVAFTFPALALSSLRQFVTGRVSARGVSFGLTGIFLVVLAVQAAGNYRAYLIDWPQVEGIRFFWQTGLSEAARYLDAHPDDESPVVICTELTYEFDAWWRPSYQSMDYLSAREHPVRYANCRSVLVVPAEDTVRYFILGTDDPASVLPAEFQGEWLAQAWVVEGVFSPGEGTALQVAHPMMATESSSGVEFGGVLLLTARRAHTTVQPGQPLRLLTAWTVQATPPPRLNLFTHLISNADEIIAQQDSLPLTTHSLRPGDRFWVLHDQIVVPANTPPGEYWLAIGFYSMDTAVRLPITGGSEQRGDRLLLMPVIVGGP